MPVDLVLGMSGGVRSEVWHHLGATLRGPEQAAFAFARSRPDQPGHLDLLEWWPVRAPEFEHQSRHYLELIDSMRGRLIKHAHDLGAALVEFHSHPGATTAQFSTSDIAGFAEWVPHVRWRLPGRPYGAVVVGANSFDSLAWFAAGERPGGVVLLEIGGAAARPTGLSLRNWGHDDVGLEV